MAPADRVEAIIDKIRARGGRATDTRRATIGVLLNTGQSHLSAEDIVSQVKLQHPEVAESTIYRNLSTLEELGVVEHVHLGHGPSTYHLTEDGHQHLLCERCGKVIEVPDETFAALTEQLAATYGFRINPRHFAIMGLCRRCHGRRGSPARNISTGSS
ncbi:MAG TPA: transcriptional repressor [Acidimicrobiales bacterium]|nr:transcriptional repressor [Acidimicrobiales bacterium]